MIFDLYYGDPNWKAFAVSAFITCFCGVGLVIANKTRRRIALKEAFLLTTLSWIALAVFASLPFMFSNIEITLANAMFESVSGITTTGATVFYDLDYMPRGVLVWRALLQWLGGIGIIVIALAVLPMLKIGGMQLFRTESSDKTDKILPRATQISGAIGGIYVFATVVCMICLMLVDVSVFDAFCHALTTVSTGGFSTHDLSIGYYNSLRVEVIVAIFMIISSLPFILYIKLLNNSKNMLCIDQQVQFFVILLILSIFTVALWLYHNDKYDWWEALRHSFFNITSILTTGGFASTDYGAWGQAMITFIFMLGVVGGCTGSTSGGIKIFRFIILYNTAKVQISKLIQPHGIFSVSFNDRPIPEAVKLSVMSFFILFAFCFLVLSVLLSFTGMDFITSMSASGSALANLGPGLGDVIGPSGNYSSLPDVAKWLLMFGMLLGRLELFTILVLFARIFWDD
ncbi:MAG: TrkH family potassium uptake protein [Rickettsiales bacterium]|nr:TrkH family potassium uptake protein [Rickettsiales bacterium]